MDNEEANVIIVRLASLMSMANEIKEKKELSDKDDLRYELYCGLEQLMWDMSKEQLVPKTINKARIERGVEPLKGGGE